MHADLLEPPINLMLIGQILLGLWITALGSSAGSFLNVVIFRWPAGRSVVNPGSRCPNCHNRVRWYDNIPILNWFWLRGRCRDCGIPISFRYPAIETLVASIFLGLYLLYVVNLGRTLPEGWESRTKSEMMHYLVRLLAFHATFFTVCLGAVMIRYDGHRIPWQLIACGWIAGLAMLTVWPDLHPVPADLTWKLGPLMAGPVSGLLGLLVGELAGTIVISPGSDTPALVDSSGLGCRCRWFEFALGGLFFGFQTVIAVAAVVIAGLVVLRGLAAVSDVGRRIPPAAFVPISYGFLLLVWRWMAHEWSLMRGDNSIFLVF